MNKASKKTKTRVILDREEAEYLRGVVKSQIERLDFYGRENDLTKSLKDEFRLVVKLDEKLSI